MTNNKSPSFETPLILAPEEKEVLQCLLDLAWEVVSAIDFGDTDEDGTIISAESAYKIEGVFERLSTLPDVEDGNNLTVGKAEAALRRLLSADLAVSPPAPETHVPCPCTLIEQDEECPIGYPSMICGVCKGVGNTTSEQVTALACEMIKIASDMGEPEDPFATWESIDLIQSQHAQFRKALDKISGMIDDESADFDDAIETATYALRLAKADATTEGSDNV